MKRKLMRPSAAFFPLAMLASAVFGNEATTLAFLLLWYALQITTLCAPDAFRNAAAREPGVRRVGKRFWGGIVQCLIGGAVLFVPVWKLSVGLAVANSVVPLAIAAFLMIIEQTFEERMFALGRNVDGTLLSLISNILLLLGLMLDAGSGVKAPEFYNSLLGRTAELGNFYLLCGCGAAVLISIIMSLLIARGKGFTPFPINCGFVPKALLQVFVYPTAVVVLLVSGKFGIDTRHMLAGLILWQLSRTVCRRIRMESKPLDWLLTVVCAVFAVLACLHPAFMPYAVCCAAVFACAAIVYLAPSVRLYLCMAVVIGICTLAYFHPMPYIL